MNIDNKKLSLIRRRFHQHPELSGREQKTAARVLELLQDFEPDELLSGLAGHGLAAVYRFQQPGRTIVFRAELDALPIEETNTFDHKSKDDSISHACGHDGHMTILIGLAQLLKEHRAELSGKIILLFQPAEEIAAGAKSVLADNRFLALEPDYIFALHNLPGFPLNKIILKKGAFASTSIGLKINLQGETSHAGHPENGRNPVLAMTSMINNLLTIPQLFTSYHAAALITIIHAKLGEEAFGTSPGQAQIMATLRAADDDVLSKMKQQAERMLDFTAKASDLDYSHEWVEYFPAIINAAECVELIRSAVQKSAFPYQYLETPFSWTEDFSFYTQKIKGAFFGLGAGVIHPQLHNSNYDFPDELIKAGIEIFWAIIKEAEEKH